MTTPTREQVVDGVLAELKESIECRCRPDIDDIDSANIVSYVSDLEANVAELEAERDEADRRAGAAERMQEREREAAMARDSWLRKAKEQWGVSSSVSFDVVWEEALQLRQQLAASQEEVARLKAECDDIKQVQFPKKVDAVAAGWRKQLAAEQLRNERLRSLLAESKPLVQDWVNENCGVGLATFSEIRNALSEPHDTAALDAYVEQKIKEAGK